MFPPGRARLATSPSPTGSLPPAITIGIVRVACWTARVAPLATVTITSSLSRTSFRREVSQPLVSALSVSVFDDEVLALHIAEVAQPLPESLQMWIGLGGRARMLLAMEKTADGIHQPGVGSSGMETAGLLG